MEKRSYIVSIISDCREELKMIGEITYVPRLSTSFVCFDTDRPVEDILNIDGVTGVWEDLPGNLHTSFSVTPLDLTNRDSNVTARHQGVV